MPGWRMGAATVIFQTSKSEGLAMLFRAPESHSRSFIKAVSWRLLGSMDPFIISFIVTHSFVFAGSIASIETVTKIILFYGHERLWALVPWGRADRASQAKAEAVEGVVPEPAASAQAA